MKPPDEPLNPFYMLLLLASLVFVVTLFGYGVVPLLQDSAPQPQPIGPFWQTVRRDGWWWLLIELAVMAVLGVASMGLDRLRSLQKEKSAVTIPPSSGDKSPPKTPDGGSHEQAGTAS